ncbi:hypothetical protein CYMTET_13276 [Cymbomonas tetramitiformis]|uniref:Uncharacterized protein n=1 Tax=Cymbomonas tetramitiformis TaxID=36881 RepID=A0AAE0GIQ4_9CHLO|nr:hypothetical protein CYMTET_13276 [Cymbomonas tetramitiformis]
MDTRMRRTRRKLLEESDLDASIRRLDVVRDSPTCRTPPVPIPAAPDENDADETKAARGKYVEDKKLVDGVYAKGRHRKLAKAIRQRRAKNG